MFSYTLEHPIRWWGTYVGLSVTLNVLAGSGLAFAGLATILLFHAVGFALLFSRGAFENLSCLVFITIATEISAVNFADTLTNISHVALINLSSLRVPGANISLSMTYALCLAFVSLCCRRFSMKRLIWIVIAGIFITLLSLENQIAEVLHDIQFVIMAIVGWLLGVHLAKPRNYTIAAALLLISLIALGLLSLLGWQRDYASESFAYTSPILNYIFVLPFFLFQKVNSRFAALTVILGFYALSGFLISGKTLITFGLALITVFGSMAVLIFFLVLSAFYFLPFGLQDLADVVKAYISNVAAEKIRQLDLINNIRNIPRELFFRSSAGNIYAEILTLVQHITSRGNYIGGGLGATLPDYDGLLRLANDGAYTQSEFSAGNITGLHLAILDYFLWFGILMLLPLIVIFKFFGSAQGIVWLLFLHILIYGTSSKFDAMLLGVFLYAIFTIRAPNSPIKA